MDYLDLYRICGLEAPYKIIHTNHGLRVISNWDYYLQTGIVIPGP